MNKERFKAAIFGSLAADAAGMGVHWIYSQGKLSSIQKKNGGQIHFLEAKEENYKGVPSFFAHQQKSVGEESNYGSYIYVLFKSLEGGEEFLRGNYIRAFQEHYGNGGSYVGYADTPMRETIYNIIQNSKTLKKKLLSSETRLNAERLDSAASQISRYFFEQEADNLKNVVSNMLKLFEFSKEEIEEAEKLVDSALDSDPQTGIDDDQMPGLTRSALLAWLYPNKSQLEEKINLAVRITNENDACVAYSLYLAYILHDLYSCDTIEAKQAYLQNLFQAHIHILPEKSQELIQKAMGYSELNYREATKTFGAACHVDMAVPLCVHILLNTHSFEEAVEANTLSSGDNCGRAIFLGAIAGALYGIGADTGIPEHWVQKTKLIPHIEKLYAF